MTDVLSGFAKRLHRALDDAKFQSGRGRTSALAAAFGVSRETSRKWLAGDVLPELERAVLIAERFDVQVDWLFTGRGDMKASTKQRIAEGSAMYETIPPKNLGEIGAQLGALWNVIGALASVTATFRPVEARDAAEAIRKYLPAEQVQHPDVQRVLSTLDEDAAQRLIPAKRTAA